MTGAVSGTVRGAAGKEERILDAARELLLRHGFRGVTIADIARRAQIGKGTVYLYWDTKEELIVELFARDFLSAVDELVGQLRRDPTRVLPRHLFPLMQRLATGRPFVRTLLGTDVELLGLLTQHPRMVELGRTLDAGVTMEAIMPALREYGVVRVDLSSEEQAFAAHAVHNGFLRCAIGPGASWGPRAGVEDPVAVLSFTMRVLLEPVEPVGEGQLALAAASAASTIAAARDRIRHG